MSRLAKIRPVASKAMSAVAQYESKDDTTKDSQWTQVWATVDISSYKKTHKLFVAHCYINYEDLDSVREALESIPEITDVAIVDARATTGRGVFTYHYTPKPKSN